MGRKKQIKTTAVRMKILLLALFLVQISLVWSKNHATTHHIDSINHRYKYEYEAHHDKSLPLPFHTLELHQDDDSTRSFTSLINLALAYSFLYLFR